MELVVDYPFLGSMKFYFKGILIGWSREKEAVKDTSGAFSQLTLD